MARHRQAVRGCRAIHGRPGPTVGPDQITLDVLVALLALQGCRVVRRVQTVAEGVGQVSGRTQAESLKLVVELNCWMGRLRIQVTASLCFCV